MTVAGVAPSSATQFVRVPTAPGGNAGSNDKVPAQVAADKQPTGLAALLAARAQYLKTGIDEDAAIGDPDHDASKKTPVPSTISASNINITA